MNDTLGKLARNMNMAFDNLCVVNIVVESLIHSMSPDQARRFVRKLDSFLVNPEEIDSLSEEHSRQLHQWREEADKLAS
ncbi:MAG: hypothetical protein AB1400_05820 [Pseudomonadota bacterium]